MATGNKNCAFTNHAHNSAEKAKAQSLLSDMGNLFDKNEAKLRSEKKKNGKLLEQKSNLEDKVISVRADLANLKGECAKKSDRIVQLETSEFCLKSQLETSLATNSELQEKNDSKDEIIWKVVADKLQLDKKLTELEGEAAKTRDNLNEQITKCEKKLQDAHAENTNLQEKCKRLEQDASKIKSENACLMHRNSELTGKVINREFVNALLKDKNDSLQAQLTAELDFNRRLAEEQMTRLQKEPMLATLFSRYGNIPSESPAANTAGGAEQERAKKRKDAHKDGSPAKRNPAAVPHAAFLANWVTSDGENTSVITKRVRLDGDNNFQQ